MHGTVTHLKTGLSVGDIVRVPMKDGFCIAKIERIDGNLAKCRAVLPYIGEITILLSRLERVHHAGS